MKVSEALPALAEGQKTLSNNVRGLSKRVTQLESNQGAGRADVPSGLAEQIADLNSKVDQMVEAQAFIESALFTAMLPIVADYNVQYTEAEKAGDTAAATDAQQALDGLLLLQARLDREAFRDVYDSDPDTGEPLDRSTGA